VIVRPEATTLMTPPEGFFVLTGGPGSGKTALVEALRARGYSCSVEAGRGVIQHQVAIQGPALPWLDPFLFAEMMLSWEMRSYDLAKQAPGPIFFDRGVPDVQGYLQLLNLPVPSHIRKASQIFRYNPTVFITPPWKEIFQQDRERKQDFDEAVRTYETMRETYTALDYRLIEVPRTSVEERLAFLLNHVPAA
jgi:predicted ATPase